MGANIDRRITVSCIARSMETMPPHYRSLLIGPIYTYYSTYHSFSQCLYCLLFLYTCINVHLFVQYLERVYSCFFLLVFIVCSDFGTFPLCIFVHAMVTSK